MRKSEDVHVAVLHEDSFPFTHITFGDDKSKEEALKQAQRLTNKIPSTNGITFVEQTGHNATRKLDCDHCDQRDQRHDYLLNP